MAEPVLFAAGGASETKSVIRIKGESIFVDQIFPVAFTHREVDPWTLSQRGLYFLAAAAAIYSFVEFVIGHSWSLSTLLKLSVWPVLAVGLILVVAGLMGRAARGFFANPGTTLEIGLAGGESRIFLGIDPQTGRGIEAAIQKAKAMR